MRRFLTVLTAVIMLSASWGCRHIAGVCDCEGPYCGCNGYAPYTVSASAQPPLLPAEPVKPQTVKPEPVKPEPVKPEILKPMPKETPGK